MIKYEIWVKRPNEERSSMHSFTRDKEIAKEIVSAWKERGCYAFIKRSDFTEIDEIIEWVIDGGRKRDKKLKKLQELGLLTIEYS